jgi:outer membrane lipoprotein SlyB
MKFFSKISRQWRQFTAIVLTTVMMSSCASKEKSVGLGSSLGAGMGAALGGIMNPGKHGQYRTRNVIVGATVGAIAGGFTGSSLHDQKEQEKEIALLKSQKQTTSRAPAVPELQQPKVEAYWVESKVVGNKWVEGHYEYVISEPTRWAAQ